jgi:hypothetical protein
MNVVNHERCEKFRDESSDPIEPGAAGWREVKMEPSPFLWLQPALDRFALVSAVVVQHQVDS